MKSFAMILGATIAAIIGFTTAHPTTHTTGNEPPTYCLPLPQGYAPDPGAPTTDAFNNSADYSKIAINQSKPYHVLKEYYVSFVNVNGTILYPEAYITHFDMKSYDIKECAAACEAVHWDGCRGFNTYIERSPSKVPGPACPNPDPTYRYVCALYKDTVHIQDVKNNGSMVEQFHVLHRGSNGYVKRRC